MISDTGPVIKISCFLLNSIFKEPSLNLIFALFSVKSFKKDATRVAQAAVPQALVSPAPRSQTLTEISFLELTCAKVTLHFSGKISWLSIFGPIVFNV